MAVLAGAAGFLHVFESLVCIYIARTKYKMKPMTVALWAVNVFLAGIFGKQINCNYTCTKTNNRFLWQYIIWHDHE